MSSTATSSVSGRCAPGRTRSRPGSPRTTSSRFCARSRNRRAAGYASAASGRGSGVRSARSPRRPRPRHRCWSAGAKRARDHGRRSRLGWQAESWRRGDDGRRRRRAAGSSSRRNSRGRSGLLMPVQRVVGGVEVEDDLLRRSPVCFQEQIDEQPLDRRPVVGDLVIARRLGPAQLEPIQRALARHRRAIRTPRRELAGEHRHRRIVAKIIVVVQVLVAERDAEHPLADQRADIVLDQPGGGARRRSSPPRAHSGRPHERLPRATAPRRPR